MSITFIGLLVAVLLKFFDWAGIPVAPESLETTVNTIGLFISAILIFWGRFRKGDVKWWGGRK